jgi:hypothetical protein
MSGLGPAKPLEITLQGQSFKRTVAVSPSISVTETRTVEGELIDGAQHSKPKAPWTRLGEQRFRHRSRHVCPHTYDPRPWEIPTEDDPPDQPHFFPTQQQDWWLWRKHRDLIFQGKGIHPADPMWGRVRALAEDFWQFRFRIQKPGGNDFSREAPWNHPSLALLYGSWCAGCAAALTALCATVGAPARTVQVLDHAMVEAWIDGQWCLADNVTGFAEAGGNMMLRASLADVLLDPTNPRWQFIPDQQGKYWQKTLCMYTPTTGLWEGEPGSAQLTPANALALYPAWTQPRFKSHLPQTYRLLSGWPAIEHPRLVLRPGQAYRRRFWLGSLDQTRRLTAVFTGPRGGGGPFAPHNVPAGGGAWFVAVNEKRYPVREAGGFAFARGDAPETVPCPATGVTDVAWAYEFEVPLADLRPRAWNQIAIGCPAAHATDGQFLRFAGHSDYIAPLEPCWIPRLEDR